MMALEPALLLVAAVLYFAAFFFVAWLSERGKISPLILNHPLLYVLSLGVMVTTWSFYTAFISTSSRGFGYNAYYLGYGAAFLFAPVLLQPILQITRTWQLSSLADVFAFRFRSPWAGTLTTMALQFCIFPLLALQCLTLSASAQMLSPKINAPLCGALFTLVMIIFTIRFGTQDVTGRDRNPGIAVCLAFESLFKLGVLLITGSLAVYAVFGGFTEMDNWLLTQPDQVTTLNKPFLQDTTNLLILLFFTAAIAMPHTFHMIFHENRIPQHLPKASWGMPLYLVLVSLPILPIFWARQALGDENPVQFSGLILGVLTGHPAFSLLFFAGGLAAASGLSIVLAMSVSNMCMNHLLLRMQSPPSGSNLYEWLSRRRKLLIIGILSTGYLCYLLIASGTHLLDAGYVSFIASVQFLPGILSMLYWPRANSKGYISGLLTGMSIWFILGLLPLANGHTLWTLSFNADGSINWNLIASLSLLGNLGVLLGVSLLTRTSAEEKRAARMCSPDTIRQSPKGLLSLKTPADFIKTLSPPLGAEIALREVQQALADLGLSDHEKRAHHMQQLRTQLETNLSALLGPTIAHQIIERFIPYQLQDNVGQNLNLSIIESQLESWPGNLSGIALDLDLLRRHHRQVLNELPIGVCMADKHSVVVLWNEAMTHITGLHSSDIMGLPVRSLQPPWNSILGKFLRNEECQAEQHQVRIDERQRWFNLHKSALQTMTEAPLEAENPVAEPGDQIILVEDLTENRLLEAELAHAERLSSIGRLAAGIAHEIGNPVTGIACLAQNMRDETTEPDQRHMAEQIIQQTRRISSIMTALITFSHSGRQADQAIKLEAVNLHRITEDAFRLLSLQHNEEALQFINDCHSETVVTGDAQRILQVLINLLTNARDASPAGGAVRVTDRSNASEVTLMVTDEGSGIPAGMQDRVFEPFFTTKDPGKGTGLGLSLVYSIISDLQGSIRFESPSDTLSDTGTRVIVTFPRSGNLD